MSKIMVLEGYTGMAHSRKHHPKHHKKAHHSGCHVEHVVIKTRRGKKVSFMAHKGPKCPPAKHPRPKNAARFIAISKKCLKKGKPGSKSNIACLRKLHRA